MKLAYISFSLAVNMHTGQVEHVGVTPVLAIKVNDPQIRMHPGFKWAGVNLGGVILYTDDRILSHELGHVQDWKNHGFLFPLQYAANPCSFEDYCSARHGHQHAHASDLFTWSSRTGLSVLLDAKVITSTPLNVPRTPDATVTAATSLPGIRATSLMAAPAQSFVPLQSFLAAR